MRRALAVGLSTAVLVIGAAPADAAPSCAADAACFYANPDGTGQVIVVRDEVWHNLAGLQTIALIVNNQEPADDACGATGPNGTGQRFCVPGESTTWLPAGTQARSIRG